MGWREVVQLGDVDSLIINDLPVVLHDVIDRLRGMNSVVDHGRGLARNYIVFEAGFDDRHSRSGSLYSVQLGVSYINNCTSN